MIKNHIFATKVQNSQTWISPSCHTSWWSRWQPVQRRLLPNIGWTQKAAEFGRHIYLQSPNRLRTSSKRSSGQGSGKSKARYHNSFSLLTVSRVGRRRPSCSGHGVLIDTGEKFLLERQHRGNSTDNSIICRQFICCRNDVCMTILCKAGYIYMSQEQTPARSRPATLLLSLTISKQQASAGRHSTADENGESQLGVVLPLSARWRRNIASGGHSARGEQLRPGFWSTLSL